MLALLLTVSAAHRLAVAKAFMTSTLRWVLPINFSDSQERLLAGSRRTEVRLEGVDLLQVSAFGILRARLCQRLTSQFLCCCKALA